MCEYMFQVYILDCSRISVVSWIARGAVKSTARAHRFESAMWKVPVVPSPVAIPCLFNAYCKRVIQVYALLIHAVLNQPCGKCPWCRHPWLSLVCSRRTARGSAKSFKGCSPNMFDSTEKLKMESISGGLLERPTRFEGLSLVRKGTQSCCSCCRRCFW